MLAAVFKYPVKTDPFQFLTMTFGFATTDPVVEQITGYKIITRWKVVGSELLHAYRFWLDCMRGARRGKLVIVM